MADRHEFAAKICVAREARRDGGPLIVARLESLVVGTGLEDALERARAYVDCGADAVLIHSKQKDGAEVINFAGRWREYSEVPLLAIPTTYPAVDAQTMAKHGVGGLVYANQALRAA